MMTFDPLVERFAAYGRNASLENFTLIHQTLSSLEKQNYVFVPYPVRYTNDCDLSRAEFQEELLHQAIRLKIIAQTAQDRYKLFDQATRHMEIYLKHFDALCAYHDRQTDIDTLEAFVMIIKHTSWDHYVSKIKGCNKEDRQMIRDNITTRLILEGQIPYDYDSYYETDNDEFYSESRKARFDKIIEREMKKDVESSLALIAEIRNDLTLPPRPDLPEEVKTAGIPMMVIEGLKGYNKEFLKELYEIYRDRDPHALFPHEF